jgi:hypothetical protein
MPRYRALGPLYLRRLIVAGEEFESELPPGRNWEPLDDEAREAVAKYRTDNAKVLSIADRLDPPKRDSAAVEIPADWKSLSGPKRRALAMKCGAQSNVREKDADSFIEAELDRRGQKVA